MPEYCRWTPTISAFTAANGYFSTQTRTATNERRQFHFAEQGLVGGINFVRVGLVANVTGACTWVADVYKVEPRWPWSSP
ncbi:MAG: hypothetical protein ABIQ18_41595, partial [Umezawaea sp.]